MKRRRKSKPNFFKLFSKFVDRRIKEYNHNFWNYWLILYSDGSGRVMYNNSYRGDVLLYRFCSISHLVDFLQSELSKGALP